MDPLATMVECVTSHVSPTSMRAARALVATRGIVGRADHFAQSIGLRNRDQLGRALVADGLPCLEDLAAWIRLLSWVIDAEVSGIALSRAALRAGKDPRPWYGTVQRLTGRTWREVRALGSAWLLLQFAAAVKRPALAADDVRGEALPA